MDDYDDLWFEFEEGEERVEGPEPGEERSSGLALASEDEPEGVVEPGEPAEGVEGPERPRRRAFLFGILVLAVIFLLGLAGTVLLVLSGPLNSPGGATATAIRMTNDANMTSFAITQTAQAETAVAPTGEPAAGAGRDALSAAPSVNPAVGGLAARPPAKAPAPPAAP